MFEQGVIIVLLLGLKDTLSFEFTARRDLIYYLDHEPEP